MNLRRLPRRLRVVVFAVVAVGVAGALVAPIVLRGAPGGGRCEPTLRYGGRLYTRAPASARAPLQTIAIGVGVLSGCGRPSTNVNVRSVSGIRSSRAVGIEDDAGLYVRTSGR